jgi:uncharacterized membrane protein HdeD (DUF308 family)
MIEFNYFSKFVRELSNSLIASGMLSIIAGLLIFLFPLLLIIVVSILLFASGVISLVFALRMKKHFKNDI